MRLNYYRTFSTSFEHIPDTCERISYLEVDEQTFVERFEEPRVPVVITDAQLDWQANTKWTLEVA